MSRDLVLPPRRSPPTKTQQETRFETSVIATAAAVEVVCAPAGQDDPELVALGEGCSGFRHLASSRVTCLAETVGCGFEKLTRDRI